MAAFQASELYQVRVSGSSELCVAAAVTILNCRHVKCKILSTNHVSLVCSDGFHGNFCRTGTGHTFRR